MKLKADKCAARCWVSFQCAPSLWKPRRSVFPESQPSIHFGTGGALTTLLEVIEVIMSLDRSEDTEIDVLRVECSSIRQITSENTVQTTSKTQLTSVQFTRTSIRIKLINNFHTFSLQSYQCQHILATHY